MQINTKKVTLAILIPMALTSCASNQFGPVQESTAIGCLTGAVLGGLTGKVLGGNEGALIGAGVGVLVGCSAGYYWGMREEKLQQAAQNTNVTVEFESIGNKDDDDKENSSAPAMIAVQSKQIAIAQNNKQTKKIEKAIGSAEIVGLSATIKGDIFKGGQTRISSQKHKKFLKEYVEVIKPSNSAVLVIGHTDSTGSSQANARVSFNRAASVADELIRSGIPKENIYVYGAGESQPIASNLTAQGRADNRRIEIVTLDNKPEYVTKYVKFKETEPAYAKLRATDNIAKQNKTIASKVSLGQANSKTTKNEVVKVVNKENKRKTSAKGYVDFGGKLFDGQNDDLFAFIGARPSNDFSIIGQAVANSMDETSCVYDEPQITTHIARPGSQLERTKDYAPGMNRTAWWGNANKHGINVSPVSVSRDTYSAVELPVVSIYENYFSGANNKPIKTKKPVVVNVYNGSNGVVYRAFIEDANYPVKCIDIAVNKQGSQGKFTAFGGQIYYEGPKGLMISEYKPSKS
ncbi:OmpA family protein [Photobacterium leiognathi]|uniref:OmpA family protein n=1 Tax=Photobacterium leiognathi TaxID=553611 RepID=UPI001EE1544B|nr:OmpA family protein [Photobacterium leiognathi]MCG3884863.1 OmpA family protein [Photobacterium leiognathi]